MSHDQDNPHKAGHAKDAPRKDEQKAAQPKPDDQNPDRLHHVPISKVLLTMKSIVDAKKENEFLDKYQKLENDQDRFVLVSPEAVKMVKTFITDHKLDRDIPEGLRQHSIFAQRDSTESCF